MAIDYEQFLDHLYEADAAFGVAAVLDLGTAGTFNLTITDKTEGVMLEGAHGGQLFGGAKIAACVRVSEFDDNSISRDSLKGATLSFNDKDWKIVSTLPKPKPGSKGELYLILQTP